ncbi:response regulator transcription factor [Actinomadura sp. HBU206391]|uniref:response regulator transcription factor n=1 Tax=Actinomadura sp. HBU206391 TaxID=2731692 RepID=UPI00164FEF7F|nr:response regulator transcription factor [Actinomadura sp. HBU206391]MBC6461208.1 response regulator transcription factor [Actinomadura sp. HBU206391]
MRIVIAEDSALLREGLSQILTRFGHNVRAAGDGAGLLATVAEQVPDVVVTDVRMPPGFRDEGLRAALELRRRHAGLPVLVLSQYVEQTYATELVETGAGVGYLLKNRVGDVTEFVDALERVAGGGTIIDPDVIRQLLSRRRAQAPLERLTAREREVLALMAEGRSNAAVARRLDISQAAVAKHINNIFTKLSLPPTADDHRRVLAVLAYLRA